MEVINILCIVFCMWKKELQVQTLLFLYLSNESLHSI